MKVQINQTLVVSYKKTAGKVEKPSARSLKNYNSQTYWQLHECATLDEIRDHLTSCITEGFSFRFGIKTKSNSKNDFESSQFVTIDFDSKSQDLFDSILSHDFVRSHCFFAYTTPSHNPATGDYRLRLVFALDKEITQLAIADSYLKAIWFCLCPEHFELYLNDKKDEFKELSGIDTACSDSTRLFYGNLNTTAIIDNSSAEPVPTENLDIIVSGFFQENKVYADTQFFELLEGDSSQALSVLTTLPQRVSYYLWQEVITPRYKNNWTDFVKDLIDIVSRPAIKPKQPFVINGKGGNSNIYDSYNCSDPIEENLNYPDSTGFSLSLNLTDGTIVWRSNKTGNAGNLFNLVHYLNRRAYKTSQALEDDQVVKVANQILGYFIKSQTLHDLDIKYGYSLPRVSDLSAQPIVNLNHSSINDDYDTVDTDPECLTVNRPDWISFGSDNKLKNAFVNWDKFLCGFFSEYKIYQKKTKVDVCFLYYNDVLNIWEDQVSVVKIKIDLIDYFTDQLLPYLQSCGHDLNDIDRIITYIISKQSKDILTATKEYLESRKDVTLNILPHQKVGTVGFKNGDFLNGELKPMDRDNLIQYRYDYDYDYDPAYSAECVDLLRLLIGEILEENYIETVLSFFAMCAQGRAHQSKTFLYLLGNAGSGKTLLMDYFVSILGDLATKPNVSNNALTNKFFGMSLVQKNLVYFDEFDLSSEYNAEIKQLITNASEDEDKLPTIQVEEKYIAPCARYVNFGIVISRQHLSSAIRDEGVRRRILLVPTKSGRRHEIALQHSKPLIAPRGAKLTAEDKLDYERKRRAIFFALLQYDPADCIRLLESAKGSDYQANFINDINDSTDTYCSFFSENFQFTGKFDDYILLEIIIDALKQTNRTEFSKVTNRSFKERLETYARERNLTFTVCGQAKEDDSRIPIILGPKSTDRKVYSGFRGIRLNPNSTFIDHYANACMSRKIPYQRPEFNILGDFNE